MKYPPPSFNCSLCINVITSNPVIILSPSVNYRLNRSGIFFLHVIIESVDSIRRDRVDALI